MAFPIGIDLGTTNSAISVYRKGRVETIAVDGSPTMPSAVCFRDRRTTLVGTKALGMAMIRPEKTILSVKRKMGDRSTRYTVDGSEYTPVDISALILEKMCEAYEGEYGEKPRDAVITVPAYFTEEQKKDTRLAGEKAGLNILRLLPEPTSAAISIGLDKGRDQTILVYDFGGGTFDVSILKVEKNDFTVKAVNGNHDLGGNDLDTALRQYALELFHQQGGADLNRQNPDDPQVRQAMQTLTSACERVKIELSDAKQAYLDLPNFYAGQHLETSIERSAFEELIRHHVLSTKDLLLKTVADAGLAIDDLDRLVMVGGSTKIPMVGRILAETVMEPYVAENVDLAVSAGAAILASSLHSVGETGDPDYAPAEVNVTDVVAHPISVAMGMDGKLQCVPVIKKNAPLPASGMQVGATDPGQLIGQLPVFRGDSILPQDNKYLGMLTLTFDRSNLPSIIRFELTLDHNGVLQVEGSILDLERIQDIDLIGIMPEAMPVKRKVRAELRVTD